MTKKQAAYSPHGWEKQNSRKLNCLTKVKAKKFKRDENLIQICENPAQPCNSQVHTCYEHCKNQPRPNINANKTEIKNLQPTKKRSPLIRSNGATFSAVTI